MTVTNINYEYGNWPLVIFNIILFFYFIKSAFRPRTKIDWTTFRWIGAFIVALFTEMYGFPLTIYLATSYFGNRFPGLNFSHSSGHLFNSLLGINGDPHFNLPHILSNILIIGGLILLGSAWRILYKKCKKGVLAKSGPYRFVRHPQYVAFIMIILGFSIQWPTLITILMAPILIWRYLKLAKTEEKKMLKKFGGDYKEYMQKTSGFIPIKLIISNNKLYSQNLNN